MDINRKLKSDLGNEKNLENVEKNTVTGIKTSDLPKNDKPVTMSHPKQPNGSKNREQKTHTQQHIN